jgi:hypothetical protein
MQRKQRASLVGGGGAGMAREDLVEGRNARARSERLFHAAVVVLAGTELGPFSGDFSASPSIVSARLGYAFRNPGAGDLFRAPTECK